MDVKGRLISPAGLGTQGCQLSQMGEKQRTSRILELQERKRSLQAQLSSRLEELRRVCLLEADLSGELPSEFPLEPGEQPPAIHSRLPHNHSSREELCLRMQRRALFVGGLCWQKDSEQHHLQSKKIVHRGCHTDDVVKSVSSYVLNSTGQNCGQSSPSLTTESPDKQVCRKASPLETYYDARTRRSSVTSSDSPSQSFPRSASGEGRSVPATPLLSRPVAPAALVHSEVAVGPAVERWSGSLEDGPSSMPYERPSCLYSTQARRSNSSEALLDRSFLPSEGGPRRPGMPHRGGPYKSSEALSDGRLRWVRWGSPERQTQGGGQGEQGNLWVSVGGQLGGGASGYNTVLMDYVWGKQQKMQLPPHHWHQSRAPSGGGEGHTSPISSSPISPPPLPAQQPAPTAVTYSPIVLHNQLGELRRVKVTRTKSCGPFLAPYPQEPPPRAAPISAGSSTLALHLPQGEDAVRSLHKALALEGLRDWYLRNALGYTVAPPKPLEAGLARRSHPALHSSYPYPLTHQPHPLQLHAPQMSFSASFHGHPLHSRSLELSLYQDLTVKDPVSDLPAPGTLV